MPILTPTVLSKMEFEALPPREWAETKVKVWHTRLPGRTSTLRGIGVDPGRRFGVATIIGHDAYVFSGEMPKEEQQWMYGIRAYDMMAQTTFYHGEGPAVVEGAAYRPMKAKGQDVSFGEANLAYIRFGFVLGMYYVGYSVNVVPPATIRAQALGSGKVGGLEVWPSLSPHAADSLAAALYAAGIRRD